MGPSCELFGTNDIGVTSPRTSRGYIATLALLQTSMVAVNSDCRSGVIANPAVKRIMLFRPGMLARFFAISRMASSKVWAPKPLMELSSMIEPAVDSPPEEEPPLEAEPELLAFAFG